MCSVLSNHHLKIGSYIHRWLYTNLMISTKQNKTIIGTQKVKKKEYKHNTKVIKSQEKRAIEEERNKK